MNEEKKDAIITVVYRDKEYVSTPILLESNSEDTIIINAIANKGTDALNMFKMPIGEEKFVVFSRIQLDECLFIIEIVPHGQPLINLKKEKKKLD